MAFNGAFFGRGRGGHRGGYRGNNYNPNHHNQQQNTQNNQVNAQKHGGPHRGGYQNPGFQQTFAASVDHSQAYMLSLYSMFMTKCPRANIINLMQPAEYRPKTKTS